MAKLWHKEDVVMLAPFPALAIGAIVMHQNAISPFVYGQNVISYLASGFFLLFFGARPAVSRRGNRFQLAMLAVGCLALAATFLDRGLENVHRWLAIGNFRLSIASLVVPCMIISLGTLFRQGAVALPSVLATLVSLLLFLQPDASQLSAFAVSVAFLVWRQVKHSFLKYDVVLLFAAAVSYSWMHIDALAPVAHVEGILRMAGDMGMAWLLVGIASLALLPAPFLWFSKKSALAKAVGLYYLVILISTFLGNFPVPFMGFGISPILGYQMALFFLRRERLS